MADKIFVDGLMFKRPNEKAPDFIRGNVSIKVPALIAWLTQHGKDKEWLNVDLKESKGGKLYFELNTWEKTKPNYQAGEANPDEIPY